MMSRHQDEERARKQRFMLELEWDEQKKLEEQLRQARQRQKQAEIYQNYKAKDAKQVRCLNSIVLKLLRFTHFSFWVDRL